MSTETPSYAQVTAESVAQVASDMRASGKVEWPWPPSIVVDRPDINIETYLGAAMNYLEGMAGSSLPRDEQDRVYLAAARGLVENGLLLVRARRMASVSVEPGIM